LTLLFLRIIVKPRRHLLQLSRVSNEAEAAMSSAVPTPGGVVVRTDLRPGDLGEIVRLHGEIYAREYGFDPTFEAYVAGPMADFVRAASPRERLWIAEAAGRIVGCVAIVAASAEEAQLRWFLVVPPARGRGLGKRLLHEAVDFCRQAGYQSIFLWTVSTLTAAAHLYQAAGFRCVEQKSGRLWSADVVEEKYLLHLH
jgi:GNAT superfamily N-acetyltransferase